MNFTASLDQISLHWDDKNSAAQLYKKGPNDGDYLFVKTLEPGITSFDDTDVKAGEAYDYKIVLAGGLIAEVKQAALADPSDCKSASTTRIKIMPLGDSITLGQGSSDSGGYRTPLHKALKALCFNFAFVGSVSSGGAALEGDTYHEGHPGWTTTQILNGVTNSGWISTTQPDVVLLMIGTNDDLQGGTGQKILDGDTAIVEKIHALRPQTHIFLATVVPLATTRNSTAINTANAQTAALVASEKAKGVNIDFVELNAPADATLKFDLAKDLVTDGIHPSDSGYAKMAQIWYQALIRAKVEKRL